MAEQLTQPRKPGLTTTDKLRMLLDITKKISRSLDLQEILNLVMDTLDSLILTTRRASYPPRAKSGRRLNPRSVARVHTEACAVKTLTSFGLAPETGEGHVGNVLSRASLYLPAVRKIRFPSRSAKSPLRDCGLRSFPR